VRCVFGTFGRLVLEVGENLCDVARHRHVEGARFVIPIESVTEVTGAGPFGGDGVELLEGVGEMLGVIVACVWDSEIINNQTEDNGTGDMGEETRSALCIYVIILVEMSVPCWKRCLTSLSLASMPAWGKTVHPFADFDESLVRCGRGDRAGIVPRSRQE
jgi:hypothetical protein